MPSYDWLFESKAYVDSGEVTVNVPDEFRRGGTGKIVASQRALALYAYIASLKQVPLPDGKPAPVFLYALNKTGAGLTNEGNIVKNDHPTFDGAALYAANCQGCHQENGEGLPGAFPPLKGSKVVLNDDPDIQITIIMKGYNGRVSEGYGIMPAVGTNNNLKPEEIAAIINHERSSWGNQGKPVTVGQVKTLIAALKTETLTAKRK